MCRCEASSLAVRAAAAVVNFEVGAAHPKPTKVVTHVWVPELNDRIHKGTVMASFNSGVRLSADRQLRAKSTTSNKFEFLQEGIPRNLREDEWDVGIGDDVVVRFSVHGSERIQCFVGRILRMKKRGNKRGWIEYRNPVAKLSFGREESVYLQCFYYKQKRGRANSRVFTFNHPHPHMINLSSVVCPVSMTFDASTGNYEMDSSHYDVMQRAIRGHDEW